MKTREIQRILRKHKEVFDELEHYDRTREKLWARTRLDITLPLRVIKRLKERSKASGKPVSRIIEDAVSKL